MRIPSWLFSLLALSVGLIPLSEDRCVHAQDGTPDPPQPEARVATVSDSMDAVLEARLRSIFGEVAAFRGISVSVRNGVVHLEGTVVQPKQASDAADLARQLDGTVYVANNLTAESDLSDRVTPALSRLERYGTALIDFLPVGLVALLVILLTFGVTRLIGRWDVPRRLRLSPIAWNLVRRGLQIGTALIGSVVVFDLLGVTSLVGALLGTAGVAGLALGFAFRDIIENYLAGVLLSLRQPFRINDVVAIGDHDGRVVRLTARELVLLTFEGNHVRLPNATVFKSVLTNYTRHEKRLFSVDVGVGTEEDLEAVRTVGINTLDAMKGVLAEPPPFARIEALGDSTVLVRFHGWVNQETADFFKVRSEAVRLVKQAFDEKDIEMPEPTHRLRLYQAGDVPPHEPKVQEASIAEEAQAIDVDPDNRLEEQVEEELRTSDEPNLLSE